MGIEKYKEYYQGACYHIYNRGVAKQDIFLDDQDYTQYIIRLRKFKDESDVSLICYCLMPNHVHLIIRQDSIKPVFKFIQRLHTSYSMYFNKKYDRVGSLWQGRFRQKIVGDSADLLYLSAYVHLNPLVAGLVSSLSEYIWSSFLDYCGLRNGSLCNKQLVLNGMSINSYSRYLEKIKLEIINQREYRKYIKGLEN